MTKKFILSWIYSSASMFLLSYVWHGVVLSDFYARLDIKKRTFILLAIMAYIILGYIMTRIILRSKLMEKKYQRRPIMKGFVVGILSGIIFFIIYNISGVSFGTASIMKNLIFDFGWQIIEQSAGGVVIGICSMYIYEQSEFVDD